MKIKNNPLLSRLALRNRRPVYTPLCVFAAILACFGFFFLSGIVVEDDGGLLSTQGKVLAGGFVLVIIACCFDYRTFFKWRIDYIVWGAGFLLTLIAIIYNIGDEIRRSFVIPGLGINVEPSEIIKIALILSIAYCSERNKDKLLATGLDTTHGGRGRRMFCNFAMRVNRFVDKKMPFLTKPGEEYIDDSFPAHCKLAFSVLILIALVFGTVHLSAIAICGIVTAYMLFHSNVKKKYLIPAVVAAAFLLLIVLIIKKDSLLNGYQINRFLDQTLDGSDDDQKKNALYAICGGGFSGKGFMKSAENFGYVSEYQNDFIFSIFCEQFGMRGAIVLFFLYGGLVVSLYRVGKRCEDEFASLSVRGIAVLMATQVILHVIVNLSLFVNTGITLPFFSSGGSALIVFCCEMGYALCVSRGRKIKTV